MRTTLPAVFVLATLAAGCAAKQEPVDPSPLIGWQGDKNPEMLRPDIYPQGVQPSPEPVIREGRYRLVSTHPSAEQKDLLAQIVRYENSGGLNITVKTAMNYITARSGYSLCTPDSRPHVATLYNLPLPEAHHKIGPMTLRNALQILAGPAYSVEVDELARGVCFRVREDYNKPVRLSAPVEIPVSAARVR